MSSSRIVATIECRGEKLNIDGKKQQLKKEENNNTGVTNAKLEREENLSFDTLRANILHKTHS